MKMRIQPHVLSGRLIAPPSKSDAHRCLILAALSDGPTALQMGSISKDIEVTVGCLRALGTHIEMDGSTVTVTPSPFRDSVTLDCGESGSTLRFLVPVVAACCDGTVLTGKGRLPERPMDALCRCLAQNGARLDGDRLPLTVRHGLMPGVFTLPGDISSQYVSGLLMALPLLAGVSDIRLTSPLQSSGYVDMTRHTMERFGVCSETTEDGYRVRGRQVYHAGDRLAIEGDWSGAAFFLAAGAVRGAVTLCGLPMGSLQKDKQIVALLRRFGAEIEQGADTVFVRARPLRGMDIDVSDIPDLVPILAVVGAAAAGTTRLLNASRLRLKESDRLHSVCQMLRALGGVAEELPDALVIHGGTLRGGVVDSFSDHRIAMAAAIAATLCGDDVTITGAECCAKSYPGFFADFCGLGGIAHELDDR